MSSGFATAVCAMQGRNTITGTYTINNSYMLKAINAITYSLAFVPANTAYKQQTKTNIPVTVNNTTIVDTVHLVK